MNAKWPIKRLGSGYSLEEAKKKRVALFYRRNTQKWTLNGGLNLVLDRYCRLDVIPMEKFVFSANLLAGL